MHELLPSHVSGLPTVARVDGPRKLKLNGGWAWGLTEGQEFFVAERHEGQRPRTICDADTGLPLVVRIGDVKKEASTGWLLGKAPPGTQLEGAVLTGQVLAPAETPVQRGEKGEAPVGALGGLVEVGVSRPAEEAFEQHTLSGRILHRGASLSSSYCFGNQQDNDVTVQVAGRSGGADSGRLQF